MLLCLPAEPSERQHDGCRLVWEFVVVVVLFCVVVCWCCSALGTDPRVIGGSLGQPALLTRKETEWSKEMKGYVKIAHNRNARLVSVFIGFYRSLTFRSGRQQ